MKLTSEELERYARHIVLPEIGGVGQQALKASKVLVVGAGGLGSPAIQYLGAAGVGTLTVVDDDSVSLSNLQRQTIHATENCGMPKVESARIAVNALNPNVNFVPVQERLQAENGKHLVSGCDIVVDGSDNFDTRYCVADLCERLEKTLVTAAVGRFDASLTTIKPHCRDDAGNLLPRYLDVFPDQPRDGLVATCEEVGIMGAITGVLGAMQAMETIKEITETGDSLAGRLLLFDGLSARWSEFACRRSEA